MDQDFSPTPTISTTTDVGTDANESILIGEQEVVFQMQNAESSAYSNRLKIFVHLEAIIKRTCSLKLVEVNQRIGEAFAGTCHVFQNGCLAVPSSLEAMVESITIADLLPDQKVSFWQADLFIHSFRLMDSEPEPEYLEGENSDFPVGEQLELPNVHLQGLWDSIVVEMEIKNMLLNYCSTSLLFAGNEVNANLISWNKMILLHGPPGTGKTSLSKALAQKIYVRNAHIFQSGLLFEVNCHSLFSKWFSESGKLVMKLFQHISDIADDESCLVTLLIDEVESIAAARNNASRSGEPGDAIRVVNAVLTSLDQLRRRKNVLVMCTSNMQSTLDEAFLDRLDLNIHIGSPSLTARKEILGSCVRELIRRGLIFNELEQALHSTVASMVSTSSDLHAAASERKRWLLDQIAEHTEGYSGRSLRKLPIKAFSKVIAHGRVSEETFLKALLASVVHI